jgi:hypothetical protein
VNKRSEEHGSRRNPRSVLRVPVISLNYSGVIPQHKLGSHSIINCGDRQSHLLPTSIVFFLLLLLLLPLYWPPTTRTRYNTTHAYHRDQKHHTVQSPRVLGQLLKGDTMPRKLTGAHTMMFPSCQTASAATREPTKQTSAPQTSESDSDTNQSPWIT